MKRIYVLYILLTAALIPLQVMAQNLKPEQRLEKIRNDAPMGEITPLFERKAFIPQDTSRKILTYFLYRPAEPYPRDLKFPLVFVLHGAPGRAYGAESLTSDDMKTAFPAFIVVPVLSQTSHWVDTKQSGQKYEALYDVAALAKDLISSQQIDPKRVYIAGCSDGGTGVFGSAMLFPDVFAAGLAISGAWEEQFAPKMTTMPLWAIHGANDEVIPPSFARNTVAAIQKNGGKAYYTEIKDMAHNCPSKNLYTPEIWSWLFRQTKP